MYVCCQWFLCTGIAVCVPCASQVGAVVGIQVVNATFNGVHSHTHTHKHTRTNTQVPKFTQDEFDASSLSMEWGLHFILGVTF